MQPKYSQNAVKMQVKFSQNAGKIQVKFSQNVNFGENEKKGFKS